MSVARVCETCGEGFSVPPSRAAQKFCSWACRPSISFGGVAARMHDWTCAHCGHSEKRRSKDLRHEFCSFSCRNKANLTKPKVRLECQWCGAQMMAFPSVANRKKFCSRTCAGLGRPIRGTSKIETDSVALWRGQNPAIDVVTGMRIGRWSIDMAIPAARVAVEIDGTYWHSLPNMVEKDKRKDAALALKGWRVVRVPVTNETPQEVAAMISTAVNSRLLQEITK